MKAKAAQEPNDALLPAAQGEGLETFLPEPVSTGVSQRGSNPAAGAEHPFVGVRSARLIGLTGRQATVALRGEDEVREVPLDSGRSRRSRRRGCAALAPTREARLARRRDRNRSRARATAEAITRSPP